MRISPAWGGDRSVSRGGLGQAPSYWTGDGNFHVARARGNAACAFGIASLWDNLSRSLFKMFEERLIGSDRPAKTVQEHRRNRDAICRPAGSWGSHGDAVGKDGDMTVAAIVFTW